MICVRSIMSGPEAIFDCPVKIAKIVCGGNYWCQTEV